MSAVDIVGLEALLAKACELAPKPLPEQDTSVGEAMAARADMRASDLWRERTDKAVRKLLPQIPTLLAEFVELRLALVEADRKSEALLGEWNDALAEIVRLRAAAEALADLLPTPLCGESWDLPDTETVAITITFGKLRAARKSLAALSQGDR